MKKLFTLSLVVLAMAFTACNESKPQGEDPVLEIISRPAIVASADGGIYEIEYRIYNPVAGASVTASAVAPWILSINTSASGIITFDVDVNTGGERRATIQIAYSGAESRFVDIEQEADMPFPAPSFGTPTSSGVTETGATISCSYSYTGIAETVDEVYFTYKTATGTEQKASVSTLMGTKTATLTGLTASTAYTFRLCVEANGNIYKSSTANFNTLPEGAKNVFRTTWPELPIEKTYSDYYYAYHTISDFKIGNYNARNFAVCYSAEHHGPMWVAAPLHNCYVTSGGARNYGPDDVIPRSIQPSSNTVDSPYNKGHMLGNRERTKTARMNKQVSFYTNLTPQNGSTFNTGGGAWNNLEDKIDTYWDTATPNGSQLGDTLYVVVGAYYQQWTDSYGNTAYPKKTGFGGLQVGVPTMYYYAMLRTKNAKSGKSVLNCTRDELQCAALVMSHAMPKGHKPEARDLRKVSDIEQLTGFEFFPNVPNAPKDTYNASDWGL